MEFTFNNDNFESEVLKSDIPVLVDFYAEWCGPCKMMAPIVEELAKEYDGKVKVGKLNIDECPDITGKYNVKGVPTFMVFKDGEVQDQVFGRVSKAELVSKLD